MKAAKAMQAVALPDPVPTGQRVMMCFTVEADCVALLRRAILAACRGSVELLRTQTIPRSTQIRIWFVLAASAASDAMLAVMRTVSSAEIGAVIPANYSSPAC